METVWHLMHHEPIEHAHRLTVPVFLFGADDDTVVPCDQTRHFFDRVVSGKQIQIFPTGNHWVVYDAALPRVAEATAAWFARHMELGA
jgi:dipeptidyl aminopeptidase/acylaminoacyl peptidase